MRNFLESNSDPISQVSEFWTATLQSALAMWLVETSPISGNQVLDSSAHSAQLSRALVCSGLGQCRFLTSNGSHTHTDTVAGRMARCPSVLGLQCLGSQCWLPRGTSYLWSGTDFSSLCIMTHVSWKLTFWGRKKGNVKLPKESSGVCSL